MDTAELLFALIRSELKGTEITTEIKDGISADTLEKLYALSAKHDLAHLIGDALSKVGTLSDDNSSEKFRKATLMAFYRYEQSEYELCKICEALNCAQIPFVALKGAVIREYYPAPWLRTSCDIDILIHKEDLEKAVSLLVSKYNYIADERKNYHDISLRTPGGVHLELHFSIKEDIETLDRVLDKVWQYTTASSEMKYKYEMTNEFLLFHVIAHLSYHFVGGGCGIRPIIDLWLLEKTLTFDKEILNALLSEAKLSRFYESVKKLAAIWLDGEEYIDIARRMEAYILRGGVYGTLQNKVLVQQQRTSGKFAYMIKRIFLPYDKLKQLYPVVIKHRWLSPLMQARRWCRIVFGGRAKRSIQELTYSANISKSTSDEMKSFLDELGL